MENKGNNNNNGGNNNSGNNKNGMTIMVFILAALLVLFLTSLLNSCAKDATNKEISYSEFINMVEEDKVESVTFTYSRINITPKKEDKLYRITYYTAELNDEKLIPLLKEHNVKFSGTVEDVSSVILWNMLSYILPLVLVWVLLYFLIFRKMGGGGMMGVGKTTAKVYVEKSTGVTFKDVAGQDEAKESLQEVVDFLHNPRKYTDIGAKLPKGALLVGPPGTGKTLLAKAVAGEAKVPFFSLAGSDFVEMFVGVGASRVRDLFKEAQKQAPCIIFIDEIDAIGKSRDTRYGGNDEREQTLNQLLAEMDGFDTSKGLLILAATNRPEVLDKALLRPGRFDRRIIVDKPDLKGRVETLKVHAKNVLMDDSVDLDAIALATSGAVGSDLANMINEAAINAVKQGRKHVNQSDLFESVEVVIAGKEKKDRIMGPKEKKMVAYHEVGHALVTALQKDAEPVQKITIVPRTMGALGYTMQVPEEEKFLMTKNELVAHLVTYMGGRAAEEIVFDSVTTGASNDIEQATKIARAMVTQYGMSEKFGLMGLVTVESQYLDGRASLNCGEETAAQIDQEVMRILKESYDEAVRLLQENRSILDKIAQHLYENETITGKEFMKIFRELKGIPEPEEKTDAQKAAERFQEEGELSKELHKPETSQGRPSRPTEPEAQIQEGELLVNTLKEDELPLEVNTLEGEAIPKELESLQEAEGQIPKVQETEAQIEIIPVVVNGAAASMAPEMPGEAQQQSHFQQSSSTSMAPEMPGEAEGQPAIEEKAAKEEPQASHPKEVKEEPIEEGKTDQKGLQASQPEEAEGQPAMEEKTAKEEPQENPLKEAKAEPAQFAAAAKAEEKPAKASELEEAKERATEFPAAAKAEEKPAKASELEEAKERATEFPAAAKAEVQPAKASTPEELGFFPNKKSSAKKRKGMPAGQEPVKAQPEQKKPEPAEPQKKAEEDSGEGYLDELLKGLK